MTINKVYGTLSTTEGLPTVNITLTIQVGDEEPITFKASAPGYSVDAFEEDQPKVKRPLYFIPSETSSSKPILVESPGSVRFV